MKKGNVSYAKKSILYQKINGEVGAQPGSGHEIPRLARINVPEFIQNVNGKVFNLEKLLKRMVKQKKPQTFNLFQKAFAVFKKNFMPNQVPQITKSGLKSDSSKIASFKINTQILRDYFLSDPLIRQALQTDVDNICTEYSFEAKDTSDEAEAQKELAEKLFYRDNFMEKWRNLTLCEEVYDDAYHEIQVYLQNKEIVFDSYVLDTPSISIKNKKNGGIAYYSQKLQGKEVAQLKPENIIHYRFNAFGDRDYGLSLISTVLYSSAIRKFIEKYNASIFMNHKPRGLWVFPGDMSEDLYNTNVDLIIEGKNDPNKDLFLRGTSIEYKNFLNQKDMDFMQGYTEARNEIIIGLGVPPIMLGLPEGSNRSNSESQLQTYDRRIRAKQNSQAYKLNTELLPKLGLDKIKFKISKANKRDEESELNIVNKMVGLVTLNEAREQLGFPELDVEEFPEAEKIWKKATPGQQMPGPSLEPNPAPIQKSVTQKKKLKSPMVPVKSEQRAIKPLNDFYDKLISESKKEVDKLTKQGKFKKAMTSDTLIKKLQEMFGEMSVNKKFATFVTAQYLNTGQTMSKMLDQTFKPNQEEINFLKNYNLDLVKSSGQREISKIKQILDIGLINNQSSKVIKDALDQVRETARNSTQTLVRTELNRANNMGSLNAMKNAGKKVKKYVAVVKDERTSGICSNMFKKYGTPEQAIPLDKDFKTTYKGKLIVSNSPPFHPNCRTTLVYTA